MYRLFFVFQLQCRWFWAPFQCCLTTKSIYSEAHPSTTGTLWFASFSYASQASELVQSICSCCVAIVQFANGTLAPAAWKNVSSISIRTTVCCWSLCQWVEHQHCSEQTSIHEVILRSWLCCRKCSWWALEHNAISWTSTHRSIFEIVWAARTTYTENTLTSDGNPDPSIYGGSCIHTDAAAGD